MRKCINCGKELNDNMSFCPEYGTAQKVVCLLLLL